MDSEPIKTILDPFSNRKINSKLTESQIKHILMEYESNSLSPTEISKRYEISLTTVYKVIKEKEYYLHGRKKKAILTLDEDTKNKVCSLISKFNWTSKVPYTTNEMVEYIRSESGIELKQHKVRQLMKENCNLRYKRVWSRPQRMNWDKVNQARIYYSTALAKNLNPQTALCNIDECWINRNTRTNYSWGLKNASIEWKNAIFEGSVNCIMAVFSNGAWMASLVTWTIDSTLFYQFLIVLWNWIEKSDVFLDKDIMMILDNWSSHRSNLVKGFMTKSRYKMCFLPPYSPHLAPVEEIFRTLKSRINKKLRNRAIKLSKNEGLDELMTVFQSITKECVKNWYITLYQNIETHVNQIYYEGFNF